jgi:hypothetical protein
MSIRTAMMEMYGAKKVKREAWVPEGIADEDVSDFMGAAAAAKKAGKDSFKFGDKTYKVTMKSTTARQIDAAKEIEEQSCECGENAECECAEPVEEALDAKDTDTVKAVVKALKGASKAHAGQAKQLKKDLQDAAHTEMDPKDHVKYNDEMKMYCVYNKSGKVVAKFKDEEDANNYAMKNHDDLMNEAVTVQKKNYKFGRMMTVNHGTSHSYPLHPEHQAAIKKLGDNQKTSFKDETGTKVTAHRKGDTVHLSSSQTRKKTPVAHSHFTESVNEGAGTAQHGPDDATSDTFNKQVPRPGKASPNEQDHLNTHKQEIALDAEEIYRKNKEGAEEALKHNHPIANKGDTSFVNPLKAEIIDGITKALQQMKTNN